MNVKELIKVLKTFDPLMPVVIADTEHGLESANRVHIENPAGNGEVIVIWNDPSVS